MNPGDQETREVAYRLWEERGRRDGAAAEDWFEAERRVKAAAEGPAVQAPSGRSTSDGLEQGDSKSDPARDAVGMRKANAKAPQRGPAEG